MELEATARSEESRAFDIPRQTDRELSAGKGSKQRKEEGGEWRVRREGDTIRKGN